MPETPPFDDEHPFEGEPDPGLPRHFAGRQDVLENGEDEGDDDDSA